MISQSRHFAETFNHVRDNARPASEADLAHLVSAREDMAPSKAHIRRLTRDRSRPFVDPAIPGKPISADTALLRDQLEHHKRAMAALGTEFRWVKPDDGTLYDARDRELYAVVTHPGKSEQTPTSFAEHMEEEQRKIDAMKERLRKRWTATKVEAKAVLLAHAVAKAAGGLEAAVSSSLGR